MIVQHSGGKTGLPAWWTFTEDLTLLLEADERGYWPGSRSRTLTEGFLPSFLATRCKKHCKVRHAVTPDSASENARACMQPQHRAVPL